MHNIFNLHDTEVVIRITLQIKEIRWSQPLLKYDIVYKTTI